MERFKFFNPPNLEDPENTRIAGLINIVSWTMIFIICFFVIMEIILIPQNTLRALTIGLAVNLICGICIFLSHKGKVRIAGSLFVIFLWIEITLLILSGGGISSTATSDYLLVILSAGLFLGWRAGFIVTGLCVVFDLLITLADVFKFMPMGNIQYTPYHYLITEYIRLCYVVVFVYYYSTNIESFLKMALQEVAVRKKTEEENKVIMYNLNQSEHELRILFSAMTDAVVVFDREAKYLKIGPTKYQFLFPWQNEKSMIGKSVYELMPAETAELIHEKIKYILETKKAINFEFSIKSAEKKIWYFVSAYPFTEESVLWIARDITEKKYLEEKMQRTQRLEGLGMLAGGIAHDLNNLLSPIMMAAEIFKMKLTDPKLINITETLISSANRGKDLVKQISTFSRGFSPKFIPLNISEHLEEITKLIQGTFPKNINIQVNMADNLLAVMGDSTQLHQVLLNLSVNARDAMPNGGQLTIKAENFYLDKEEAKRENVKTGEYLVLTVTDTGEGIPGNIQDKLFEPFFTTKKEGKGTGLGLATVLTIVREHKGFIKLNSQVGKGTEFKIFLPAIEYRESGELKGEIHEIPFGNGELILVIDDEVSIQNMTREVLETYGYRVKTFFNGIDALVFLSDQPDGKVKLVITDFNMPKIDGLETIKLLRGKDPNIKVIIASGSSDLISILEESEINVQGTILKPFTSTHLLQVLNTALTR